MRLLSSEYFHKHLASLYHSIFTGLAVEEGCFVESAWEMVLVPYGLNFEEMSYRALGLAAETVGDREVIITDIEPIPPHQATVVMPWTREVLEEVRCDTLLGHVDCVLFGQSSKWGAVVMKSEDGYTCIGGTEQFLRTFTEKAGSLSSLKERFSLFKEKEWQLDTGLQQQILAKVGWN
jgi:hypothetical protein